MFFPACGAAATATATAAAGTRIGITLDGGGAARARGRQLEGFGAISGGGSTSRLLADYPEPYCS